VGECRETKTTKKEQDQEKTLVVGSNSSTGVKNIKAAIAKETVLAYPDFLKPLRSTQMPLQHSWEP
jgi:hypothetical protein